MKLTALVLFAITAPLCAQTILVQPYIQPGDGPDAMTVIWLTDQTAGDFSVEYGAKNSPPRPAKAERVALDFGVPKRKATPAGHADKPGADNPEREQHYFKYSATLAGLPADSVVDYQVKLAGKVVRQASFATHATAAKPIRFVMVGDLANGNKQQNAVAFEISRVQPQFLVALGDIVYPTGRVSQYMDHFWSTYNQPQNASAATGAPLMASVPFYAVLGNHDADTNKLADLPDALGAYHFFHAPVNGPGEGPWSTPIGKGLEAVTFRAAAGTSFPALGVYSFDNGPAHFLVLDNNGYANLESPKVREWIERDLRDSKPCWKFVCYHAPMFHSSREHYGDQKLRLLEPLLESCGVDVTFAGHVHNYQQNVITRADYLKQLHIFAISHRKNGVPYLAEALHPDTGSFEGHDGHNHSEHYFHSSFNDLIITGLIGLKTRADVVLEIDPLAPADWPWFALDDVPYRGHRLSILWDKDGSRYHRGAGLRVLVDGKEIASQPKLGKLTAKLPLGNARPSAKTVPMNYAVNNDGDYYPRFSATFTDSKSSLAKINDGNSWYALVPPNRWSTAGSPNATDSVTVDFGTKRAINTVKLFILDDGAKVVAPASYEVEYWTGTMWKPIPGQNRTPAQAAGHLANIIKFPTIETAMLRTTFIHGKGGKTGLTELEAWGEGILPYVPAPPPAGNVALNLTESEFPKASASFHDVFGGLPKRAFDGKSICLPTPMNRWTSYGSPNETDWLEVDFGNPKEVGRVDLHIYDDRGGVQPPVRYNVQYWANDAWHDATAQVASPAEPAGGTVNTVKFTKVTARKIRVVFTNKGKARSGVTEMEVWKE